MSYEAWKDKVKDFALRDVRGVTENFFLDLKSQAEKTAVGGGMHIVQTFEPIPLYEVMGQLGFEYHTEQVASNEWHVYFYRTRQIDVTDNTGMRPAAITNFAVVDDELAEIGVKFWNLIWNDRKSYLPNETRTLIALSNAVGARRMRQAARELVKVYAAGIDSRALDDVFELFAWNQGFGFFVSEICQTALFAAYKYIKEEEKKGTAREEICKGLKENFGETNPEVKVL